MKNKPYREEQGPPFVILLALLLIVAFVATTPLAFSKYAAKGTGTAGARIAKWDPSVAEFTDAFSKTAFIDCTNYGWEWLPINDLNILDPSLGAHTRGETHSAFILRPDNENCEVMTQYEWELTSSVPTGWSLLTHVKALDWAPNWNPGLYNYGANGSGWEGTDPNGVPGIINSLNSEPGYALVKPLETKPGVSVNIWPNDGRWNAGYRPYAANNCYARITFAWTATQVD